MSVLMGSSSSTIHDYLGGFFYKNDSLLHFQHEEGRFLNTDSGYRYEYCLKDHLGNVRVTFSDKNGNQTLEPNLEVIQVDHYYPFGLQMAIGQYEIAGTENRYRYNGKELHNELNLGWYDYGFRWYDPSIARFISVDPLAESFPHNATYAYAENRPIDGIDLEGLEFFPANAAQMQHGLTKGGANNGKVKPIQPAPTDRRGVVSEILNWIPFVGDAKGLVEVVTNEDMATGEKVGPTRFAGLLGLGEFKGIFKGLGKLFSRSSGKVEEAIKAIGDAEVKLSKVDVELEKVPGRLETLGKQRKELQKELKELNSDNDPQGFSRSRQEDLIKETDKQIDAIKEQRANLQNQRNKLKNRINERKKELGIE